MNFFIAEMNDALLEAKNVPNENKVYELVDECDWRSTQESKILFDAISDGIRRLKVNEASDRSSETEIKTPELNSRSGKAINVDLISQAIKNARKPSIPIPGNEKPSNTGRESFFDKASYLVGHLKKASYDDQNNNKKERKVRFRNDVIKSQLKRLQKTKKNLFKHLDGISPRIFRRRREIPFVVSGDRCLYFHRLQDKRYRNCE